MKIDSSKIGMESTRSYKATVIKKTVSSAGTASVAATTVKTSEKHSLTINYCKENQTNKENSLAVLQNGRGTAARIRTRSDDAAQRDISRIQERSMFYLIYLILGRGRRDENDQLDWLLSDNHSFSNSENGGGTAIVTTETEQFFSETEKSTFSTAGVVKTSDGRELSFNMEVGMSRSYREYAREINVQEVNLCDPLVINLDTELTTLSDQKFFFDLDADGKKESISKLSSAGGYLALDKNGDGIINDGSELFGTASGDGFRDLATYDEDHNGWIDENDKIYSRLQIWAGGEHGKPELYRIAEAGIGAICLQKVSTDYTIKSTDSGEVNGVIRSTGIFLYENGMTGTVQHLDVAN